MRQLLVASAAALFLLLPSVSRADELLGSIELAKANTNWGGEKGVVDTNGSGVRLNRRRRNAVIAFGRHPKSPFQTEIADMQTLERLGVPTVPILDTGYVEVNDGYRTERRPAMIMPKLVGSSQNDFEDSGGGESSAVRRSISTRTRQDLKRIRGILERENIGISDFQFLIDKRGRVFVNDVRIEGRFSERAAPTIDHLLKKIDRVLEQKQQKQGIIGRLFQGSQKKSRISDRKKNQPKRRNNSKRRKRSNRKGRRR